MINLPDSIMSASAPVRVNLTNVGTTFRRVTAAGYRNSFQKFLAYYSKLLVAFRQAYSCAVTQYHIDGSFCTFRAKLSHLWCPRVIPLSIMRQPSIHFVFQTSFNN